jgi:uncharacterized protein
MGTAEIVSGHICFFIISFSLGVRWYSFWHTPDHISPHKLHGFYHPGRALHNAQKEYHLTPREKDIIKKHMWPLTISAVPMCREAWIVTMADKWCSLMETFHVHKGHGALIEKLRKIEEEQGK